VVASGAPPLAATYQSILDPVAIKLATVAACEMQKVCEAEPVGAAGVVFMVTVTSNLAVLSQPLTVWLA
jgi:hypothetical protein